MATTFETMQIGETETFGMNTYVVRTGENKWSVCDNGEEVVCYSIAEASRTVLENELTDEAVEAWYNSELDKDLWKLFGEMGIDGTEVQIWGTREAGTLEVVVSI